MIDFHIIVRVLIKKYLPVLKYHTSVFQCQIRRNLRSDFLNSVYGIQQCIFTVTFGSEDDASVRIYRAVNGSSST